MAVTRNGQSATATVASDSASQLHAHRVKSGEPDAISPVNEVSCSSDAVESETVPSQDFVVARDDDATQRSYETPEYELPYETGFESLPVDQYGNMYDYNYQWAGPEYYGQGQYLYGAPMYDQYPQPYGFECQPYEAGYYPEQWDYQGYQEGYCPNVAPVPHNPHMQQIHYEQMYPQHQFMQGMGPYWQGPIVPPAPYTVPPAPFQQEKRWGKRSSRGGAAKSFRHGGGARGAVVGPRSADFHRNTRGGKNRRGSRASSDSAEDSCPKDDFQSVESAMATMQIADSPESPPRSLNAAAQPHVPLVNDASINMPSPAPPQSDTPPTLARHQEDRGAAPRSESPESSGSSASSSSAVLQPTELRQQLFVYSTNGLQEDGFYQRTHRGRKGLKYRYRAPKPRTPDLECAQSFPTLEAGPRSSRAA